MKINRIIDELKGKADPKLIQFMANMAADMAEQKQAISFLFGAYGEIAHVLKVLADSMSVHSDMLQQLPDRFAAAAKAHEQVTSEPTEIEDTVTDVRKH
jgi:hypothetical protein